VLTYLAEIEVNRETMISTILFEILGSELNGIWFDLAFPSVNVKNRSKHSRSVRMQFSSENF
jgi:hypothetical protein